MSSRYGRYHPVEEGKWDTWNRKENLEQCCDCLLIHRVEFRIITRGSRQAIEFRCWREDKATARARKRYRIRIVKS